MIELFDLKSLGEIEEGIFLERPNRFVGICEVGGKKVHCHVADPGRLKEILTKNRKVFVVKNPKGYKTDYRLVAVSLEDGIVLLNTSVHSKIGYEAIKSGVLGFKPERIKKEVPFGKSRIDYLVDGKIFVELKGCNLKVGKKCLFPDAPTERGRRHLEELIEAKKRGFKTVILVMILRECECFAPNFHLDKKFSETFIRALKEGVKFKAFRVSVRDFKIYLDGEIPLCREVLEKIER